MIVANMSEPKCCSCFDAKTGIKILAILEVLAILSMVWFVATIALKDYEYFKCKDAYKYRGEIK